MFFNGPGYVSVFSFWLCATGASSSVHPRLDHHRPALKGTESSNILKPRKFTPLVDAATFLARNKQIARELDPQILAATANGQSPSVYWISCSDSRVPMSIVAGAGIGEAFSSTNIANQYHPSDPATVSALGFAVKTLLVPHIVVVGHEGCGGCAAALNSAIQKNQSGPAEPANNMWGDAIGSWVQPIQQLALDNLPLSTLPRPTDSNSTENKLILKNLVELNVLKQVENIIQTPIVQTTWEENKDLSVHGWVYDISTGLLREVTNPRNRTNPTCSES